MSGLGGKLVGIGIGHKNNIDFKWLNKPIHNRIVHTGIEHLLKFAGSNTETFDFTLNTSNPNNMNYAQFNTLVGHCSKNEFEHWGALYYCAYGDGNTPTKFFDTKLQNQLDITDTKYVGSPYCGSKYEYVDNEKTPSVIKHRISHKFKPVNKITKVRELGWFGRTQNGYVMFSRVVLPNEITLNVDDFMVVTYELTETDIMVHNYEANILKNNYPGNSKIGRWASDNGLTWGSGLNSCSISVNGTPNTHTNVAQRRYYDKTDLYFYIRYPAFVKPDRYVISWANNRESNRLQIWDGININPLYMPSGSAGYSGTVDMVITVKDYIPNTYSREFTLDKDMSCWGGYSGYPITVFCINGTLFRCDGENNSTNIIMLSKCTFRTSYMTEDTIKILNGEEVD